MRFIGDCPGLVRRIASTVLKAARMFDGTTISTPGLVVVTGNRITGGGGPRQSIPPARK